MPLQFHVIRQLRGSVHFAKLEHALSLSKELTFRGYMILELHQLNKLPQPVEC